MGRQQDTTFRNGLEALVQGWNVLRLAVEAPERVPFWDVIAITAAGEKQAALYEQQVARIRRRGLLPQQCRVLVVPDPGGRRIGSGGATLHALRMIRKELPPAESARQRILLIHAGGDSRRLPWAGVFGKAFVPTPVLADPDSEAPSLLEHLIALFAPLAGRLPPRGTLVTITGDVLLLFDAAGFRVPDDAAMVVTKPVPLSIAGRHGVIIPGREHRVARILQKPSPTEIERYGGLVEGGAALVDTGLYIFSGGVLRAMFDVAASSDFDIVQRLVEIGRECSLYEEIAGALVPASRASLPQDDVSRHLLHVLRPFRLTRRDMPALDFLHFGTSAEVLEHLFADWGGIRRERILSTCGPGVAADVIACTSDARAAGRVGSGSLLLDCRIGPATEIGNRCVIAAADLANAPWSIPSHTCLWQLPVHDVNGTAGGLVTFCCGVDDNPKLEVDSATFCNVGFRDWLRKRSIPENAVWQPGSGPKTLWNARLFPVHEAGSGAHLINWMLAPDAPPTSPLRSEWLETPRVSMADAHRILDLPRLLRRQENTRKRAVMQALRTTVQRRHDRNVHALAAELPARQRQRLVRPLYSAFAASTTALSNVRRSRMFMILADLAAAAGLAQTAEEHEQRAFEAIQEEVSAAVEEARITPVTGLDHGRRAAVTLPVRFDVAGGWSDTPPYCLEHPAAVLNIALRLDGKRPVGAEVEALKEPVWDLTLADGGTHVRITDGENVLRKGDLSDPFLLVRTALVLTGYGRGRHISQGVRIRTWADVPRGSGLGTSSILGAALIAALQRLAGREHDHETVSGLVLNLEQMMTTGGGWQDQVGGLVPGVKLVSSRPTQPLRLRIETVPLREHALTELRDRFIIAFSGQERLARDVLHIVVRKYLRRDAVLLRTVQRLVRIAHEARDALALGDVDALGNAFAEVWALHQQLDPHCSNPHVDAMFAAIAPYSVGAKLAGAGGGGFMGIVARNPRAAQRIRDILDNWGHGVKLYDWTIDAPEPEQSTGGGPP